MKYNSLFFIFGTTALKEIVMPIPAIDVKTCVCVYTSMHASVQDALAAENMAKCFS